METPVYVLTRPFAIELSTGVMMPDGIFDNALYRLQLTCHFTNTSDDDLLDVELGIDASNLVGVHFDNLYPRHFDRIAAGASVMVGWSADWWLAQPSKPWVGFSATAVGFSSSRSDQQIFISQTRYDQVDETFVCTLPEGGMKARFKAIPPADESWWPGSGAKPEEGWGPWVPAGIQMTWTPAREYSGVHGPLPFDDPFWKVAGLIVFAVASIAGVIAAALGHGTFQPGVKGKFDETASGVVTKCCTPDPGGGVQGATTLAGALAIAASVGLVVALSDEADPMWRGQAATPPVDASELTHTEIVDARWSFVDEPRVGEPWRAQVRWSYERLTTGDSYHFEVEEEQVNAHLLNQVEVSSPANMSRPGNLSLMTRFVRPGGAFWTGPDLYTFALLRAPSGMFVRMDLSDDGLGVDERANDGIYSGELSLDEIVALIGDEEIHGRWEVCIFAQEVNRTIPGTPPQIAARTIGGQPIASGIQLTFDPSQPCPLTSQASIDVP